MFKTNFSSQIKSELSVRRTKIPEYGKRGEFSASNWKTKIFSYFPVNRSPYVKISSLRLEWIPTVSHLLEGVSVVIDLSDSRSNSRVPGRRKLASLKRGANMSWVVDIDIELFVPTSELKSGLPLTFDIEISNAGVKENSEIGKLMFSMEIIGSKVAEESRICNKITPNEVESSCSKNVERVSNIVSTDMNLTERKTAGFVCSYLRGEITMEALSKKIREAVMSSSN